LLRSLMAVGVGVVGTIATLTTIVNLNPGNTALINCVNTIQVTRQAHSVNAICPPNATSTLAGATQTQTAIAATPTKPTPTRTPIAATPTAAATRTSTATALPPTATRPVTPLAPIGCQFQTADQPLNVAFCDTFEQPRGSGADRSGDLFGTVWGVSRISSATNPSQGQLNNFAPVDMQKCTTTPTVLPDSDVAICNGQLVEAVNDNEGQTILAMYPKQPFDIAGRTGTATFDVSADSEGGHAAWPTFVYTDQPVPAPYSVASTIATQARNSFGFTLAADCSSADNQFCMNCPNLNQTSVDTMFVTRNYVPSSLTFKQLGCVARPSSPNQLNHFEVRISQAQVQVWGSDPGSTVLRELAQADNANLPLTRGLIWIEDVHYNANKFNDQRSHTFGWDNVGFDGPVLPRDLTFDVVEPKTVNSDGTLRLGWSAPSDATRAVQVLGVYNVAQAQGAAVLFTWSAYNPVVPSIRVNGGAWHGTAWPLNTLSWSWKTIAVPVPLAEIHTGTNTIEFKTADPTLGAGIAIANVDLLLIGAGGAPCNINPSQACGTPTPTQ